MLSNTSPDFELIVRQQPEQARVAGGKEKGTFCVYPSENRLDKLVNSFPRRAQAS